ncbi:AimR family lysis-lysogeny pheromone receptor [Virgibacillus necropolis]|uniref:AimR family lysis-lysogeny pheromone receptor n=1 Tax=Virgibacillus necropolis TaxID=163877 RepID=UPI00384CEE2B
MTTESVNNSKLDIIQNGKLSLAHAISMLSVQHDEQTVLNLVRKLCMQSNENEIMKKGLEFLYMNGFYEDLQLLIDKNIKSKSKSNNQWAAAYQLMLDRKLNRLSPPEIIHRVTTLQSEEPGIICLIEFLKISTHYDMRNFGKLGDFLDKQPYLFAAVDDPFLLSFFNIRLCEILFTYYWVRNELIMARKYAFRVLNLTQNPRTKAAININLALTYTFDTYKQGMYHLQEATKVAKKHGLMDIIYKIQNNNIPFISAHHGRVEGVSTSDPSELAHIEIAKGNHKKAEDILRKLSFDSPFQQYYLGLATNDKDLLHQSHNNFINKRSDHFFGRLPILALQEMGA